MDRVRDKKEVRLAAGVGSTQKHDLVSFRMPGAHRREGEVSRIVDVARHSKVCEAPLGRSIVYVDVTMTEHNRPVLSRYVALRANTTVITEHLLEVEYELPPDIVRSPGSTVKKTMRESRNG